MSSRVVPVMLFEERTESVYFLAAKATQAFVDRVAARLEPDEHCREQPGGSAHYVTTLYFDSDSQAIARACAKGAGVRLRAREYYDRRPPDAIDREPFVWLEVKSRDGGHTRKVRFPIPTSEVSAYLQSGYIDAQALREASWSSSAEDALQALGELCMHTREPLRPDCVAHYRRRAWQDSQLRVTVDTELSFYRPPAAAFVEGSLSAALVEPPVGSVRESLVEIKLRGPMPRWLHELVDEFGLQPATGELRSYSKFIAASRAVHG